MPYPVGVVLMSSPVGDVLVQSPVGVVLMPSPVGVVLMLSPVNSGMESLHFLLLHSPSFSCGMVQSIVSSFLIAKISD